MDFFPTDRAGNNPHRATPVITPGSDPNPVKAGITGWEKGGMPAKQSFGSQFLFVVLSGIQQYFNNTIGMLIPYPWQPSRLEPKSTGH
jgi:hypothetical protein